MTDPIGSRSDTFEAGLEQGVVRVERCLTCGFAQSLDPMACQRCGSVDLVWEDSAGTGVVHAVTHVDRAPTPAFRDLQPYTIVLVTLDGGSRIMGHGAPGVAIGDKVTAVVFRHDGTPILRFVLEESL